jgi:sulfate adenylyltransferase subunit 1
LQTNDIARVDLQLAGPIFTDTYRKNKATGSFILIDEQSNQTLAVGMIS